MSTTQTPTYEQVDFGTRLARVSLHPRSPGSFKMYNFNPKLLWCELFIEVIDSEAEAIPHFIIAHPAMPRCDKRVNSTGAKRPNTRQKSSAFRPVRLYSQVLSARVAAWDESQCNVCVAITAK